MSYTYKHELTPIGKWQAFPKFSLIYFAWTILVLVIAVFTLDRVVLPYMEDKGQLACEGWRKHDEACFWLMAARNHATFEHPVCWTDLYKVNRKCSKSKRILVLGDSFVWGHGVSNLNYVWWRQLEKELQRRGYNDVEVIGAGMCGASTHTELEWAKQLIKEYHPDMILWGYVTNDPVELNDKTGKNFVQMKPVTMRASIHGLGGILYSFLPNLIYHLLDLREECLGTAVNYNEKAFNAFDFELEILKGPNFERYKQTVGKVSEFIKESGIPNLFVMLIYPDAKRMPPRLKPVESLFDKNQIPYLDFLSPMVTWYNNRFGNLPGLPAFVMGVCPVDCHPGPLSTHFYAVQTANTLEKNYASSIGPRSHIAAPEAASIKINDCAPANIDPQYTAPNAFTMTYPDPRSEMLTMPLRRKYAQLNFEEPQRIKEIQISGDELSSCAIALGLQDPESHEYQVGNVPDLGFKNGQSVDFSIPKSRFQVSEIKLSANFSGSNRKLLIKFIMDK